MAHRAGVCNRRCFRVRFSVDRPCASGPAARTSEVIANASPDDADLPLPTRCGRSCMTELSVQHPHDYVVLPCVLDEGRFPLTPLLDEPALTIAADRAYVAC